jgi:RNA polymerase sigma-70 factor (ECF subfamily)
MRAALDGNETAYQGFLLSIAPVLRTVAERGCKRAGIATGDAEDIVQDLAIHLKRHTWRRDEAIAPWIFAIMRNKLVDALRRRGRAIQIPIEDFADILQIEDTHVGIDNRVIDKMLACLKGTQRDIVSSISVEGRSLRETAKRLNMSEGAIRVALHRALKALAVKYIKGSD